MARPRQATKPHVCIVCGASAKERCPPCWDAGVVTGFCSRDHYKLVWFGHRDVCGANANPCMPPPVHPQEIKWAEASTPSPKQLKWNLDMLARPDFRQHSPDAARDCLFRVRAIVDETLISPEQVSVSHPSYILARWNAILSQLGEDGDIQEDDLPHELYHHLQVLATLVYLGKKPVSHRPKVFKTDFVVDVVKRTLELLAPIHTPGESTKLFKALRTMVKPVVNLQGEIGRREDGMTGRVEVYQVGGR